MVSANILFLCNRNAVNAIARNFPGSKVVAPIRTNSVRQSKLLIHKRPVENIPQSQEHSTSPLKPLRKFAHEKSSLSHARTVSDGFAEHSISETQPSPRYPTNWGGNHPANHIPRPLPITPSSSTPERIVAMPHSRMLSNGTAGYDKPLDRERVLSRLRSGPAELGGSGPSRTSGRASPRPESPSLPPPPRSRRGDGVVFPYQNGILTSGWCRI